MPGHELFGEEEKRAVLEVFEQGAVLYRYGFGQKRGNVFRVDEFEKMITQRIGARYALCVCNGTAALKLALMSVGVRAGDEVITQSFTFVATAEAILELGAKPIITEVDKSLNMDPADLEKKITQKTRAIIPVHMAGVAAKMAEITQIATKHNIPIVEDSAQALGGTYGGKHLGTIGKAGIYSLDFGKVITTGEGGLLVTDDEAIYRKAREYSDHGHEQNASFPRGADTRTIWGFNYKATELHGAIGLAQLKKLDFILERQRENKQNLKKRIADLPGIEFREIPDIAGDSNDTLIFFMKTRQKATQLARYLSAKGIGTKNLPDAINWHYAGTWIHIFQQDPLLCGKNLENVWLQSTNYLRRAIALPIFVNMPEDRIQQIDQALHEAYEA